MRILGVAIRTAVILWMGVAVVMTGVDTRDFILVLLGAGLVVTGFCWHLKSIKET